MAIDPIYLDPAEQDRRERRQAEKRQRRETSSPEHLAKTCRQRMAMVDSMSPDWRAVVHEVGLPRTLVLREQCVDPVIYLLSRDLEIDL